MSHSCSQLGEAGLLSPGGLSPARGRAGTPHPLREPARRVIRAVAHQTLDARTDVEVLQEILHRYFHIGERAKGLEIFDQFHRLMSGRILPVEEEDVVQARRLAERYPHLGPRDLIHLAVAVRHRLTRIVTADAHFDGLAEVQRVDPRAFPFP